MDKNLFCPRYVDYVRECAFAVGTVSREMDTTLRFCTSGDYKQCPFFRFLENPSAACENFDGCPLCAHYKKKEINQFVEMTDEWCLKNFSTCARHQIKKSGGAPDEDLHPSGQRLTD